MIDCSKCNGTGNMALFGPGYVCDECQGTGKKSGVPNLPNQKLISEYIKTVAGRRKLSAVMSKPVRGSLDYNAIAKKIGRKTFVTEPSSSGLEMACAKLGDSMARAAKAARTLGKISNFTLAYGTRGLPYHSCVDSNGNVLKTAADYIASQIKAQIDGIRDVAVTIEGDVISITCKRQFNQPADHIVLGFELPSDT